MTTIPVRAVRISVLLAVVAALMAVVRPAEAAPQAEADWIVVMAPGRDVAGDAPGLATGAGGRVGHVYDNVLGGFAFHGSAAAASALERNPNVTAVVPSQSVFELADVAGWGFFRIDADLSFPTPNAYRGAGTRSVVIDSGLDLNHPDFQGNVDLANAINCVTPGASVADDQSHGTHVAGILGADDNGTGVVGVAPDTEILPLKAFDATGFASDLELLCAMNHLAGVMIAEPMPTVLNMSFTDVLNGVHACDDGEITNDQDAVHEALCDLDDLGAVLIAATGNGFQNIDNAIPAGWDEVISVSGYSDIDGIPGGLGGCDIDWSAFHTDCDDTYLDFSNYGADVDVMAPGFLIYSTVPGGGGATKSGTSMAAPHVAGVAAIMLGEDPTLTSAEVLAILEETGECPDGSINVSGGDCSGSGTWPDDPDSFPEPLVNALRAAEAAAAGGPGNEDPTAGFSSSCTDLSCDFTDLSSDGDGSVVSWSWDFGDGQTSSAQNPSNVYGAAGTYSVGLTVTDDDGATDTTSADVTVTDPPVGNEDPTADAGPDQVVPDTKKKGTERVRLDGRASSDPDGSIVSYTWTDDQGGVIATGDYPNVTLAVGVHAITLTVEDDLGATATDDVTITVGDPPPPPGNEAPTADAGPDQAVQGTEEDGSAFVTLNGTASSDPDGTIATYEWRNAQGQLIGTGSNPTVLLPLGINVITLEVTDDDGATDTDDVTIIVDLPVLWTSHLESMTASTERSRNKWNVSVEVFIMWTEAEELNAPVGADPSTVTVSTSTGQTLQCTTVNSTPDDQDGKCTVTLTNLNRKKTPSVTFTVTDVFTPGFAYEADYGHHSGTVTVSAP